MLAEAGITEPPVDLMWLAQHRGIAIEFEAKDAMGDLMGSVRPTPTGGARMRINASTPARHRFTIAHEIAHTVLSPSMGGNRTGLAESPAYRQTERLCDRMAAEMLMPTDWFNASTDNRPFSLDEVGRLAQYFDTSVQTAAVRLVNKMPGRAELICWEAQGTSLIFKWRGGAPKLTRGYEDPNRLLERNDFGALSALALKGSVFTKEASADGTAFEVESRAYQADGYLYVLSLVKPFINEKSIAAANFVARARARK
jgi:hypothetical protein